MKEINELIIDEALKDLGIQEIKGNQGWKPRFILEDLIDPDQKYSKKQIAELELKVENEANYVKKFQKEMESITGWQKGWAWCLTWSEYVWFKAYMQYNSFIADRIKKLILPSATGTWNNFKKQVDAANFTLSKEPVKGAIAIWQKYKDGKADWTGHGAIVYGWDDKVLKTIDGNTNSKGSREGIEIAKMQRPFNFNEKNGLRLLGFIHPLK